MAFVVRQEADGSWTWKILTESGELIAVSHTAFASREQALGTIAQIKAGLDEASVDEELPELLRRGVH